MSSREQEAWLSPDVAPVLPYLTYQAPYLTYQRRHTHTAPRPHHRADMHASRHAMMLSSTLLGNAHLVSGRRMDAHAAWHVHDMATGHSGCSVTCCDQCGLYSALTAAGYPQGAPMQGNDWSLAAPHAAQLAGRGLNITLDTQPGLVGACHTTAPASI